MPRIMFLLVALLAIGAARLAAQEGAAETCQPTSFPPIATYNSAETDAAGRVTFRLCHPAAGQVQLAAPDLLAAGAPALLAMQRDAGGMWSVTTAPLPPGNYRYSFMVDGVDAGDPRATNWAPGWSGADPFVEVRGGQGDLLAWRADVAHGAVSEISYWSAPTGLARKALVYTPPGYMSDGERYPVLYLVHGATGSHHSWISEGAANVILDNLIASGAARRMIVVMPHGHPPALPGVNVLDEAFFGADLHEALIPFVDASFRTIASPAGRAMAGLSMGGDHTIRFGLPRSDVFSEVGIFSMGLGYAFDPQGLRPDDANRRAYEEANAAMLRASAENLKLVYVGMGTGDPMHFTAAPLLAVMDAHGIAYHYNESGGGHDWLNWRAYLADFAPRLFRE